MMQTTRRFPRTLGEAFKTPEYADAGYPYPRRRNALQRLLTWLLGKKGGRHA